MSRLLALAGLLGFAAPLYSASPLPKAPPGFRVELILEAPAIEAPTALCVAPNGDVYFAEDPMDMSGPPTKNIDTIWLLKGGDPKKKLLFADKMWAVMGLEIVRDKLYVVHAPHVTVFTLDADGKAKKREELFDDLGPKMAGAPSFNDHIPSGIRMGMDGWLYVSIGDKGIPKMMRKEDRGSVHVAEWRWRRSKEGHHISLEGGGVIRFRPDGSGLEVFASGTRNHLDVPMDEHDRIFVRDNTDNGLGWWTRLMYLPPGGYMGYPWAYTQRQKETLPMIHDFGGGSPCGGYVYCDDGLPEMYRDHIFHCEWGQGKVLAVKVAPDCAGFKFVDQVALLEPGAVKDFRAIQADAIPALIQATGDNATRFDAITALAQPPDKRALSAYLTGLGSKSVALRETCRQAIATLRDEVVPTLQQLAKGSGIPSAALAELREVYSSFVPILSWRVVGPFPRDAKAHPPQSEQKLDAVYKGAEKDVKWQPMQGDARQQGRVNLAARLSPNSQVVAYAVAEIESATTRDATLLCGSDDTITIWLNGKKVHDQQGDRGWNANQDKVNVHLEKGKNRLLIQCGNSGGPWEFSVALSCETGRYAFLKGGGQRFDLEMFRAHARKNKGDTERGRKLFMDTKGLACIKCHAVGGQGGLVGPDLAGIGLRYNREDLMTSILEPSKVIAQGYETIVIETKKGQVLTGVFKGESDDAVNLTDNEGKPHRILKKHRGSFILAGVHDAQRPE